MSKPANFFAGRLGLNPYIGPALLHQSLDHRSGLPSPKYKPTVHSRQATSIHKRKVPVTLAKVCDPSVHKK